MTITMTVGDLILLNIVSHNETICIWAPVDSHSDMTLWHGPFWQCPQKYLDIELDKIFGCIPESIVEADTINIRIKGAVPDYDKVSELYKEAPETNNITENYTLEAEF